MSLLDIKINRSLQSYSKHSYRLAPNATMGEKYFTKSQQLAMTKFVIVVKLSYFINYVRYDYRSQKSDYSIVSLVYTPKSDKITFPVVFSLTNFQHPYIISKKCAAYQPVH